MRTAGLLFLSLSLLACGVGSGSTSGGGGGGNIDPGGQTIEEILLCSATLTVTGSLAPAGEPPAADAGCVPEGIWTLNVAVDDPGDCAPEDIAYNAQYQYEITRDADEQLVMTYLGSDSTEKDLFKPASAGGTCRANIEHYAPDGSWWLMLHPFEDDLVITGSGEFELYDLM